MLLDETAVLANGNHIPRLGLGTWQIPNDDAPRVVHDAIAMGYRLIDTAQAYENERGVGQGIRESGVERERLFVTTKLVAECKTFEDARERIYGSLDALGLEYIDLMLIHSPQPWAAFREDERFFEGNLEAWRALEEVYASGTLRAIGVSNFEPADLDNLIEFGSVAPMVNQVLAHVGNTPFDLIDYCRARNILVEAYSPVAHGAALQSSKLAAMADDYGVTVAQLCIRYCLQLDLVPLPKTANIIHLRDNADVDFVISEEDMTKLKGATDEIDYGEAARFPVFGRKRV